MMTHINPSNISSSTCTIQITAEVAQSVRAFASHAEGWLFETEPRQTCVVKKSSDSSTAKRSATDMGVTGPRK